MKIERRDFLSLSGTAVAGAALSNGTKPRAQRSLPKSEYDYVDWSWENYYQANRRIQRHGTKAEQVRVYRILLDCPTERAMLASVTEKASSEAQFLQLVREYMK